MKKCIVLLAAVFALFSGMALTALEVDKNELQTSSDSTIEFINYTGPLTVISTVEEIRGIGTSLGRGLVKQGSAGNKSSYYVIHAVDAAVKTGFDADILILGEGASVDHINNLRRIISAYLTAAYGYSDKDASTLATFITVYNAVNRGKIDSFKSKYKPVVMQYLTADKAGLSVLYSDWPGKTQIVIPLSDARLAGTLSAIDTSTIASKDVVEKLREEPGAAIDTRKDLAELKDRESDAAQERATDSQVAAAEAKSDAAAKKAEADAAAKEAAAAKATADAAAKAAAAKPDDKAAQAAAAETKAAADQKAAVAAETKTEATVAQTAVAEKEAEAATDQRLADTKAQEAQAERKEIASDVQKEINAEAEAAKVASSAALASAIPALALRIVDEANLLSELVLVNLADGKVMVTSPLNSIRNRIMIDTGSGLMAVAGKKGGGSSVRLVLINPTSLELLKTGTDNIAEKSMLVKNANDYYAVIELDGGKYVLARFDANLEAKAKSALEILSYTPITVTASGVLVQDKNGRIRLLRATDLVDQTVE